MSGLDDNPYRPPTADPSPTPDVTAQDPPMGWNIFALFGPLLCVLGGPRWLYMFGLAISLPCAIIAGRVATSHFQKTAQSHYLRTGLCIGATLVVFHVIVYFVTEAPS